jgi:hypothetical protein|tara:strand:- start:1968 stop:2216 length:249 start_codon:yes stop_codon:yes gene_type:complete
MSEDKKNTDVPEAQTQVPAPEGTTELTITDLNALKQIIDVASQRGAFKPNEMMTVGSTYNKLETFLSAVAAQAPAPDGLKGD